jgi:hypothetical protein
MKIAIALATYNGAKFLREQLESLLRQSRPPDHVVISDDSSTDDTLGIAEVFRRSAPYRVDIVSNQNRLGPMGNFIRAANTCEAEFVAFCDQDDIWMPTKLELCERALQVTGSLAAIHALEYFCQTSDKQTRPRESKMMPSGMIDGLKTPPDWIALGMAMVVRKTVLETAARLKLLWEPRFESISKKRPVCILDHWSHAHDMYVLTAARLMGSITCIEDVLACHRVHQSNYSLGGSPWRQDAGVAESWGHAQNLGYRVLSAFCMDFAEMMAESACSVVLSEPRQRLARQYYERWAALWRFRAQVHEDNAPLLTQIADLGALIWNGAYRARFNGGLGKRSLVKDALTALGFRSMKIV